ncbi:MAG TPA: NAD(P)H-hydrate dehydratase [Bacillales bacterium]|nr:NAD(P)H-hydrate dehydratase [Bacillales bacterium]
MHVVTGKEMGEIDRVMMESIGLSGPMLMENAGQAVARKLLERLQPDDRIAVLIGSGNNGGDGFVVARVLLDKGYDAEAWLIPPRTKIKGDAKVHFELFERAGFQVWEYSQNKNGLDDRIDRYTVIVDAMLGTGVRGVARQPYKEWIERVNASGACVISVDLPSGVHADGGELEGPVIRADRTFTLQCPKLSALTYPSAEYYGEWELVDIGILQTVIEKTAPLRKLWQLKDVNRSFPRRSASSHKGSHGKGLLVAGSREMTGAAVLSAKAALRGGAGLLATAVPDIAHPIIASQVTEATYKICPSENGFFSGETPFDLQYDAIAVGPGMGREKGPLKVLETLLKEFEGPLVIDADGLFHLKELTSVLKQRNHETILTPHPGEMARLLDVSAQEVQASRFEAAKNFAVEYGVYLVLKGPYTIVTTPEGKQFVNSTGNPALAKGGTGDVLTGLILAFIMQHSCLQAAISNAVYLHGMAADRLVRNSHSSIDVTATDVIEEFPAMMHELFTGK